MFQAELATHRTLDDPQIWIAMNGLVYDVTKFHRIHPGGSQIILQHAGKAGCNWNKLWISDIRTNVYFHLEFLCHCLIMSSPPVKERRLRCFCFQPAANRMPLPFLPPWGILRKPRLAVWDRKGLPFKRMISGLIYV